MLTHYVSQPPITCKQKFITTQGCAVLAQKAHPLRFFKEMLSQSLVGQWQAGVVLGCIAAKNAALDTPFAAARGPGSRKRMRRLTLQNSQK